MCIAIPSEVVELHGDIAVVERFGERLAVSLALMSDTVGLGDYVIIQARAYAVDKVDAASAREIQRLLADIFTGTEALAESS